ncbi:hypothetical protein VTL71DRAFT_2185 [Oculimacula yallundae]|uniref:Uncharacterized protein n=1 Tax=Oculimacula yallundae TaxID=86028 RepID=A0ABR4C858_9HELO
MCHIRTTYSCDHSYLDTRPLCVSHRAYLQTLQTQHKNNNQNRNQLQTPPKRPHRSPGLFSCFPFPSLSLSPTRSPSSSALGSTNLICRFPPGQRFILDTCPTCKASQQKADEELAAHRRYQSRELKMRGSERCATCIDESRYPSPAARKVNGGLCCEKGVEVFERQTRMRMDQTRSRADSRIPLSSSSAAIPVSAMRSPNPNLNMNSNSASVSGGGGGGRGQRTSYLQHVTFQQIARQDASRAAKSYGGNKPLPQKPLPQKPLPSYPSHPSHSQHFSPSPSPSPRAQPQTQTQRNRPLPSTPLPSSSPVPLYQEPGIDWARWETAKQGNHGRLPPLPEIPLPILPLNVKVKPSAKTAQRGVRRIERKPVPVSKTASEGLTTKRTGGGISPLAKAPVSVMGRGEIEAVNADEVMGKLDGCLERALYEWQPQPVKPQSRRLVKTQRQSLVSPAPVFRKTSWNYSGSSTSSASRSGR